MAGVMAARVHETDALGLEEVPLLEDGDVLAEKRFPVTRRQPSSECRDKSEQPPDGFRELIGTSP